MEPLSMGPFHTSHFPPSFIKSLMTIIISNQKTTPSARYPLTPRNIWTYTTASDGDQSSYKNILEFHPWRNP